LDLGGVDEVGGVEEGSEVEVAGVAKVVDVGEQFDEGLLHVLGVAGAGAGVVVQGLSGVTGTLRVVVAGPGSAGGGVFTIVVEDDDVSAGTGAGGLVGGGLGHGGSFGVVLGWEVPAVCGQPCCSGLVARCAAVSTGLVLCRRWRARSGGRVGAVLDEQVLELSRVSAGEVLAGLGHDEGEVGAALVEPARRGVSRCIVGRDGSAAGSLHQVEPGPHLAAELVCRGSGEGGEVATADG
jgi:hypothetical protein